MKVIYGRPGTVLLTAEDEGVEICYAFEMKARVGGRRLDRADYDFQLIPGFFHVEDFERSILRSVKTQEKLVKLSIHTYPLNPAGAI
jgi:hypothetical protein